MDGFADDNQISEINKTKLVKLLESIVTELFFRTFAQSLNHPGLRHEIVLSSLNIVINYKIRTRSVYCTTDPFLFCEHKFKMSFTLPRKPVEDFIGSDPSTEESFIFNEHKLELIKKFELTLLA